MNETQVGDQELVEDIKSAAKVAFTMLRRTGVDRKYIQTILRIELEKRGKQVRLNMKVPQWYEGQKVSEDFIIDLIVDNKIGVCIKRAKLLTDQMRETVRLQVRSTKLPVFLLISFGGDYLQTKRIDQGGGEGISLDPKH